MGAQIQWDKDSRLSPSLVHFFPFEAEEEGGESDDRPEGKPEQAADDLPAGWDLGDSADLDVQNAGDFGGDFGLLEDRVVRPREVDLQAGQGFNTDHVVGFEHGAFVRGGDAADEAVADGGPFGSSGNVNGEGPNDVADAMSGDDDAADVAEGDENPVDGEEIKRDRHPD